TESPCDASLRLVPTNSPQYHPAGMERIADKPVTEAAHWNWSIWLLGVLALLAWQTWLALGLFGPEAPWNTLVDDRPVLSGSHPQHLYLGSLGAQALAANGT